MAINCLVENDQNLQETLDHFQNFEQEFYIEYQDIELEQHIKQAYSILETSKLKIKTNYLNYFALQKTFLPDIIKIFSHFQVFPHICAIFESVLHPNENEVIDEYNDVVEAITKFNNQLPKTKAQSFESNEIEKYSYSQEKKMKQDFLFDFQEPIVKKKKNNNKKFQTIEMEKPLYNFLAYETMDKKNLLEYQKQYLPFQNLLDDDLSSQSEQIVNKEPVVLNYREKNYYYLKKGTKARKKAKQSVQVEIINDSTQVKKKKKKRTKKKDQPQSQEESKLDDVIEQIDDEQQIEGVDDSKADIVDKIDKDFKIPQLNKNSVVKYKEFLKELYSLKNMDLKTLMNEGPVIEKLCIQSMSQFYQAVQTLEYVPNQESQILGQTQINKLKEMSNNLQEYLKQKELEKHKQQFLEMIEYLEKTLEENEKNQEIQKIKENDDKEENENNEIKEKSQENIDINIDQMQNDQEQQDDEDNVRTPSHKKELKNDEKRRPSNKREINEEKYTVEVNKITIREPTKRTKTRRKNNRTVERKMRDSSDEDNTPNLLKERNFKIFDKDGKFLKDQEREKIIVQSVKPSGKTGKSLIEEKIQNEEVDFQDPIKKSKKKKKKRKKRKKTQIKQEEIKAKSPELISQMIFDEWVVSDNNKNLKDYLKETFQGKDMSELIQGKDTKNFKFHFDSKQDNINEQDQKILYKIFQNINELNSPQQAKEKIPKQEPISRARAIKKTKKMKEQAKQIERSNEKESFMSKKWGQILDQEQSGLKGLSHYNCSMPDVLFLSNLMDDFNQFSEEKFYVERIGQNIKLIAFND